CSFDAALTGDASGPAHSDTVTASASDGEGNTALDTDSATVAFTDVLPSVAAVKTPSAASVPEPGASVTFTVEVENTSVEPVTMSSLSDDVFGDLLDPSNPAVSANTCPTTPAAVAVGATFTCSFEALLAGDASGPDHLNTVTATATDGEGNPATDDDAATVGFDDVLPSITTTKTALPDTLTEPGGTVTFLVQVENESPEGVTLTSLSDDVFGDLLDGANPAVSANTCDDQPTALAAGTAFTCTFDAAVTGLFGDPDHVDTVTAAARDDEGNPVSDADDATVAFTDALPTISVSKTPSAGSVPEPGGTVTFSIEVDNTSGEPVTLTSLSDDVFGDLLDGANPAVANNTCVGQPASIAVGGTLSCSFDAFLAGMAGDPAHVDTVTATASDGDGNTATNSDDATVAFGDELATISVSKTPSVGSIPEPGGTVTYAVEVANTSAEDVTLTLLVDDVFGDLLDGANPAVSNNTCDDQPAAIAVGGTLSCSFDAFLTGDYGDPDHVNVVHAQADDGEGNLAEGSDDATVAYEASFGGLTGHLFVDEDGDGVQDPGEPDLPGVDVVIVDDDGTVYRVTSDGDGNWAQTAALGPANLAVDPATVPAGHLLTTANDTQTVAVPAGGVASEPIGYQPEPASVAGTVWVDLDLDLARTAPEPPLGGVTIRLRDDGGTVIAVVATLSDGSYLFDGVLPGDYTVEIDQSGVPDGYALASDPDGDASGDAAVSLAPGEDLTGQDFVEQGTGSVGDLVWLDEDADGGYDAGEPPLSGITVGLVYAGADGVLGTADDWEYPSQATGADGLYRFSYLPPGTYRGAADLLTVGDGMSATTPPSYEITLLPGQDWDDGDIGFGADEELPMTGIDADRIGLAALVFLLLGASLLLIAREVEIRRRRAAPFDRFHRR
ncbi:MAG: hypothetical protein KQH83_10825, partial [Actinobacteria bacterium]|nr:hypothetical protein [Actinomycetota bacterium]